MAFTYNPATDDGKVRLLIADTNEFMADNATRAYVFDDSEIAAFVSMKSGNVNRAAAVALRSMAASKARMERRLKTLDVELDTKGYAAELRALAKELDQADEDSGGFAIAEFAQEPFGRQERLTKERQRHCD